ncbi:hypothetical protein A2738_00060 [Candidatus Nomurabacteria bacterium RIFCSPHIGHO2_01_FULL_42_15]|uniref:RDD domain-containing protein n=1 Tax=Candidatus Nomurabacteria bacterium RIFCSPHIGHO2_01_FULL_42_15 TaxID=1801742 RepID=A0A1F6VGG1_9BACT|nr:MAG: hypothetical protein A2738_00060 [Candidatus Nomurabacteria bacterium RIFCSPHIGHO2_01_FULL_42_15]OGI92861.1 MAG: hypothetical protein A3A99_02330 [Candidatus Nomurabacteria bacterium RIFCSPLOWO2_01_FULL_41_18]
MKWIKKHSALSLFLAFLLDWGLIAIINRGQEASEAVAFLLILLSSLWLFFFFFTAAEVCEKGSFAKFIQLLREE